MFLWRNESRQGGDDLGGDIGAHDDQNLRTIDVLYWYSSNLAGILSLPCSLPDIPRTTPLRVLTINGGLQEEGEED